MDGKHLVVGRGATRNDVEHCQRGVLLAGDQRGQRERSARARRREDGIGGGARRHVPVELQHAVRDLFSQRCRLTELLNGGSRSGHRCPAGDLRTGIRQRADTLHSRHVGQELYLGFHPRLIDTQDREIPSRDGGDSQTQPLGRGSDCRRRHVRRELHVNDRPDRCRRQGCAIGRAWVCDSDRPGRQRPSPRIRMDDGNPRLRRVIDEPEAGLGSPIEYRLPGQALWQGDLEATFNRIEEYRLQVGGRQRHQRHCVRGVVSVQPVHESKLAGSHEGHPVGVLGEGREQNNGRRRRLRLNHSLGRFEYVRRRRERAADQWPVH